MKLRKGQIALTHMDRVRNLEYLFGRVYPEVCRDGKRAGVVSGVLESANVDLTRLARRGVPQGRDRLFLAGCHVSTPVKVAFLEGSDA